MAQLNMEIPREIMRDFQRLASDNGILKEAVDAGLDIMYESISNATSDHVQTGELKNSIRKSKATENRFGYIIGRIVFYGKSQTRINRKGEREERKVKIPNHQKALWIEYGAGEMPARPFVTPAIKKAEFKIRDAMQKVIDRGYEHLK